MSPQQRSATVAERLREKSGELTAAERKLMSTLFANYPMAGLVSITEFAREAEVSTPSVLRLAKKLGFTGFPAFQEELRAELSAQLQNPIAKHDRWAGGAPDAHILNRFASAALENLSGSLKLLDHRVFDATVVVCSMTASAAFTLAAAALHRPLPPISSPTCRWPAPASACFPPRTPSGHNIFSISASRTCC